MVTSLFSQSSIPENASSLSLLAESAIQEEKPDSQEIQEFIDFFKTSSAAMRIMGKEESLRRCQKLLNAANIDIDVQADIDTDIETEVKEAQEPLRKKRKTNRKKPLKSELIIQSIYDAAIDRDYLWEKGKQLSVKCPEIKVTQPSVSTAWKLATGETWPKEDCIAFNQFFSSETINKIIKNPDRVEELRCKILKRYRNEIMDKLELFLLGKRKRDYLS